MKAIKYIMSILVIASLNVLLFSCMDDEIVKKTDDWCDGKTLILTLNATGSNDIYPMTRSVEAYTDTSFTDVNLLVYNESGEFVKAYYYGSESNLVQNLKKMDNEQNLSISDLGDKATGWLFAIANYKEDLSIMSSSHPFYKKDGLLSYKFDSQDQEGNPKRYMFAEGQYFDVTKPNQNKVTSELKRIYSMITVRIDKTGLDKGIDIQPLTLQLKHIPTTGVFGSRTESAAGLPGNLIANKEECYEEGVMQRTSSDVTDFLSSWSAPMFMYENRQPDGTNTDYDQSKKTPQGFEPTDIATIIKSDRKCSYIEITANYVKGTPDAIGSGEITYRFFLGKDEKNNFDVERNVNYKITLTLTGKGGVDESSWRVDTDLNGDISITDAYLGYRAGSKTELIVTGDLESLGKDLPRITLSGKLPNGNEEPVYSVRLKNDNYITSDNKKAYLYEVSINKTNVHSYEQVVAEAVFTLKDGKTQRKAKIYQVPRLVDPIAIYKRSDNDKETEIIVRKYNQEATPGQYETLPSKGPWSATIQYSSSGDWFSIYFKDKTTGKYKAVAVGETIEGEGDVRFWYKPNGTNNAANDEDRFGMILVKYHNNSCEHEIYVRQGYRPVVMDDVEGAAWSAFNCLGRDDGGVNRVATSPTQTGWLFKGGVNFAMHPFKPGYREDIQNITYSDNATGGYNLYKTNPEAWEYSNGSKPVSSSSIGKQGPCPDGYVVPNAWEYRKMAHPDSTEVTTGYVYDDDYDGTRYETKDGRVTYGWHWDETTGDAIADDGNHCNPAKGSLFVKKGDHCTNLFFSYGKGVLTKIREVDEKLVAEIGVGHRYVDGALTYTDHIGETKKHAYGGFYWNATAFARYGHFSNTDHMGKVDFGYNVFSREPNLMDVPGQSASIGGGEALGIDGNSNASFVRCVRSSDRTISVEAAFEFVDYGNNSKYISMETKYGRPISFALSDLTPEGYLKSHIEKKIVINEKNGTDTVRFFDAGGNFVYNVSVDVLTNPEKKIILTVENGKYVHRITDIN